MGGTAVAEVSGNGFVVKVGNPIIETNATAEGEYDELVGGIAADVARYICAERAM
jgi:hypothetical protein